MTESEQERTTRRTLEVLLGMDDGPVNPFWLQEAIASTELDRGQTHVVDGVYDDEESGSGGVYTAEKPRNSR